VKWGGDLDSGKGTLIEGRNETRVVNVKSESHRHHRELEIEVG